MREKVLVRATNWVGDLVMSTPALAAIRKNYPDAEITVIVRPPLQELLEGSPWADSFIPYDRKAYSGATGAARLGRELRKYKFDRAILLQNAFEAAFIAFLAKIPVRMGYRTDGRGLLLTDGVKVSEETKKKHQIYYYLDMLAGLGLKADKSSPRLYLTDKDKEFSRAVLKENGIGPKDLIVGINPGAQYGAAKKWFPERFAEVADRLAKQYGTQTIIFGGPGDTGSAGAVEAAMKERAVNLAGKTGIRGLMALTKRCSLFVTNDTGPMHVSAALGVPTLAVFGSTNHIATGPFGDGHRIVRDPVNCAPCLKRKCPLKHYKCMENVSAERVLKAAGEMLEERLGKSGGVS